MTRWIDQLWTYGKNGRYGYRMPGTPACRRGAEFVLDKFREFGLEETFIEEVDTPLCLPDDWKLEVRSDRCSEEVACSFIRYAGFTPAGGISAPIVYLSEGSESDFECVANADRLVGKIVLVDLVATGSAPTPSQLFIHDPDESLADTKTHRGVAENWPIDNLASSYKRACIHGAAGYIGILNFSTSDNCQYHHWYADGSIPALTISPRSGTRLKSQLLNTTMDATLTLTGEEKTGPISHVFATLPGKTDESIAVHTHHDGWAVNEASGTSVVLALAKHFAAAPAGHRARTLKFVAFDSHFGKRPAMPDYWIRMLPQTVAAISIEMIGKHYEIIDGEYVDRGMISPTIFGVTKCDPAFVSMVRDAVLKHELDRSIVIGSFFGDGNLYNIRGVPLIERIAHNAPQFTNEDTPDKVMIDKLRPTAAAFVDIIRRLDTVPSNDLAAIRENCG